MRPDYLYLDDALTALRALREFAADAKEEQYLADRQQQSFVFHQLFILGQAAATLPPVLKARYDAVPWVRLEGLHDRLLEGDLRWSPPLWTISAAELEEIEAQLRAIREHAFPESERRS